MTSVYQFVPLERDELETKRLALTHWFASRDWIGHVLLATEGINLTVAKLDGDVEEVKRFVVQEFGPITTPFKDSVAIHRPFRDLRVDIREEIVGLKRPDLAPLDGAIGHLTPDEWHAMLQSESKPVLIDTRNTYETRIGKFAGALDPGLTTFSQWTEFANNAGIPSDQPVMIYCTGGIRCEKVMLDLKERGFEEVYQLSGGILAYLEKYPDGFFEGECFVFDDCIAVDHHLQPTQRYGICPGCGLPSETTGACDWCGGEHHLCPACQPKFKNTCSKTCLDRIQRHGPRAKSAEISH